MDRGAWQPVARAVTKSGMQPSMQARMRLSLPFILMRRSELGGSHPKRCTGFGVKQTWILSFPSWVSGLAFLSLGSSTKPEE